MFTVEGWDTGKPSKAIMLGMSQKLPPSMKSMTSSTKKRSSRVSNLTDSTQKTTKLDDSSTSPIKEKVSIKSKQKRKKKPKNKFKDSMDKEKVVGSEVRVAPRPVSEADNSNKSLKTASSNTKNISAKSKFTKQAQTDQAVPSKLSNDILRVSNKSKLKKNTKTDKNSSKNLKRKHTSVNAENMEGTVAPKKSKSAKFDIDSLRTVLSPSKDEPMAAKLKTSEIVKSKKKDKRATPMSLADRMRAKLNAARFRYLNEQLYTTTGQEAQELFQEDPESFRVYHDGFESQVAKWPMNPVDRVISFIRSRPKTQVIADFGCGDAKVARGVPHTVHSFDLVAVNETVTVCDMANVPLSNSSVDICVFCLSLMGTNLVEYLSEAHRVLKQGGTLLIAEVGSRFDNIRKFTKQLEKIGFTITKQDDTGEMFVWFELRKTGKPAPASQIPDIELAPCLYKKR